MARESDTEIRSSPTNLLSPSLSSIWDGGEGARTDAYSGYQHSDRGCVPQAPDQPQRFGNFEAVSEW